MTDDVGHEISKDGKPNRLTRDSFVVQSNELARGVYQRSLEVDDLRLINAAMAKLERDGDLIGDVHLTADEMRRLFPAYGRSNTYGAKIDAACSRLMGLFIHVSLGKGQWQKVSLIRQASYNRGAITILFDEDARSLLLRLSSGNYTSFRIGAIATLKSVAQMHLYRFARSYAHRGRFEASPKMLRQALNIPLDAYVEEHRFVKWVLKPAVEAINKDLNADIHIAFEPVKRSRKTESYTFKVSAKSTTPLGPMDQVTIEYLKDAGIVRPIAEASVRTIGAFSCLQILAFSQWRIARKDQPAIRDATKYLGRLLAQRDVPELSDPDQKRLFDGLLLNFRLKVYDRLDAEAKRAHQEAFVASLKGKAKSDWERFKLNSATHELQLAWRKYISQYIANPSASVTLQAVQPTAMALPSDRNELIGEFKLLEPIGSESGIAAR